MLVQQRPTVAVIGGGFSGVLTALRLLEDADGPRVRLVERRPRIGPGAAYSTPDAEHLLNVRAQNMSAFPEDPTHFCNWLAQIASLGPDVGFVSRSLFGEYLQTMLRHAAEQTQAGRLILESDAATALEPQAGGWSVQLEMGRAFFADTVVLAVGNLPPHAPPSLSPKIAESRYYIADPWATLPALPPSNLPALLLGTGLTMVDVAQRLAGHAPGLTMMALSRRGLLPRRHLVEGPSPQAWSQSSTASPRAVVREFRRCARSADWRAVIDGLRPQVQEVWRGWTIADRQQFLRHLRPWWDVHRHRIAPAVASRIDHLTANGRLAFAIGRLDSIRQTAEGFAVSWKPRGGGDLRSSPFSLIINCTGPQGDLSRASDPLLSSLAQQGWIRADACGLGLDVSSECRLIAADGDPLPNLYGVGPVTRGAFWEITSVPDIRVQALACARRITAGLKLHEVT